MHMLLTRGLQDQTPLPRNTFPSFCHQHGPRVVDGCIALLGERHLPIILSQALLAVEDAHLGRLQHKQTHWQVPQGLCRLAKENMWWGFWLLDLTSIQRVKVVYSGIWLWDSLASNHSPGRGKSPLPVIEFWYKRWLASIQLGSYLRFEWILILTR